MPDTFDYYVAAYLTAGILYAGYVLSLWLRARSANRREPQAGSRAPDA